jgi:hypothetical protein
MSNKFPKPPVVIRELKEVMTFKGQLNKIIVK